MENPLLKGFHTDSLNPKTSALTNLKAFARCRNLLGCSLETETLAGAIFMTSGYLANAGAGRHYFGILPLTF